MRRFPEGIDRHLEMASSRETVSKLITTKLIGRIIDGVYPVGSRLPTEREIAEEFSVTRNVVREALKRLEALGLVDIRRGSGIYVEDLQVMGGVEVLELLIFKGDGSVNVEVLRDVIEFYENTIVSVIRLATRRISDEELAGLREMVGDRSEMIAHEEDVSDISREIVGLIVDATHNSFYRLIYNTMLRIPVLSAGFFNIVMSLYPDVQTYLERLVEAFRREDQEMAALLTTRMFETYEGEALQVLLRMALEESGKKE